MKINVVSLRSEARAAKVYMRVGARVAGWLGLALWVTVCLVPFSALQLGAQSLAGINGTVTDQSGAVVGGAKIMITNNATGVSRAAVTSSVGTYYVTDLIPGTYTVKIEAPGFKVAVEKDVNVQTASVSTANAVLVAGQISESVEVTAPEIALETEQPVVSTTIQETLVNDLPQIISGTGRQIDSFLFLAPGVTGDSFSHRIDGGLDFQNEVVFNGVPIAFAETQGFQQYINPQCCRAPSRRNMVSPMASLNISSNPEAMPSMVTPLASIAMPFSMPRERSTTLTGIIGGKSTRRIQTTKSTGASPQAAQCSFPSCTMAKIRHFGS